MMQIARKNRCWICLFLVLCSWTAFARVGVQARTTQEVRPVLVFQVVPSSGIFALSFAADGRELVSGGGYGAEVWDTKTLEVKRHFSMRGGGGKRWFLFNELVGDKLSFISESDSEKAAPLELYDKNSGRLVERLPGVSLSYDNLKLTYRRKGLVRVLDARTRRVLVSFESAPFHDKTGDALYYSNDTRLVAEPNNGKVKIWRVSKSNTPNAVAGLQLLHVLQDERGAMGASAGVTGPVIFSPDNKVVMTSGSNPKSSGFNMMTGPDEFNGEYFLDAGGYSIKFWSVATGKLLRVMDQFGDTARPDIYAAFTLDGARLVTAYERNAKVWDVYSGKLLQSLPDNEIAAPYAISPDVRVLASSDNRSDKPRVQLWDLRTGKLLRASLPAFMSISVVDIAPDGKKLLVADGFRKSYLWDLQKAHLKALSITGEATRFIGNNSFASSNPQGADIWNLAGQRLRHISSPEKDRSGNYSGGAWVQPDGKAFRTQLKHLRLWNVRTRKLLQDLPELNPSRDYNWSFSPDGYWLLKTDKMYDTLATIQLWNLRTAKVERTFSAPDTTEDQAFFWRGWGSFLTKEGDNFRLHDTRSGRSMLLDKTFGTPLVVSPDGRLAAFGQEGWIEVRDAASFAFRCRFRMTQSFGSWRSHDVNVFFSHDNTKLFLNAQGVIQVFDFHKGLVATLRTFSEQTQLLNVSPAQPAEWIIYTPQGHYAASRGAAKFVRWRVGNKLFPASRYAKRFLRPDVVRRALSKN